ncbi:MAG: FprA family A-type flavoprotein, partial [Deltaproteobacteria bacterium]
MKLKIADGIHWLGFIDWDRRLFDSLIPLPEGTSYNCYLIEAGDKRVLVDSADPSMREEFLRVLDECGPIDFVISHHAEQDHSGLVGEVLERNPSATVLCSEKAAPMLVDLLHIDRERIRTVADGEKLSIGTKTLEFVYTPWVHWPETMCTYVAEDKVLFSCDLFGSHLATSRMLCAEPEKLERGAKRYFAEIMMPFSGIIQKNLQKLERLEISTIAPSHGPVHVEPQFILERYRQWCSGDGRNLVVVPYVSMHDSTKLLVDHLCSALMERGVDVERYELTGSDAGELAMSLVDATTLVLGTPTVLAGPHPLALYAAFLANQLRPR